MLNLAQTREVVKQQITAPQFDPAGVRLNHARPDGMNEAYRQLKALGWTSRPEMHADGVPLFRLDSATIRRDKTSRFNWIVEAAGDVYDVEGGIRDITEFVREKLAERPEVCPACGQTHDELDSCPACDAEAIRLTINQRRQLEQLKRLAPKIHAATVTLLADHPDLAGLVITQGYQTYAAQEARGRRDFDAAAARKMADRLERRRSRAPFSDVPGDGGATLADLDAGPTDEYMRMLRQEMARRARHATRHHDQSWRTDQPTVGEQIEAARESLGGALKPGGPTIKPNWNGRNW